MNEYKCDNCGKYLSKRTFYTLYRPEGELKVWVCPQCGFRNSKWVKK